jgi:hypothetical protein
MVSRARPRLRGRAQMGGRIYHDDVVIEWPQSGEVIRGNRNIRELRLAFPIPPTATLRRIIG